MLPENSRDATTLSGLSEGASTGLGGRSSDLSRAMDRADSDIVDPLLMELLKEDPDFAGSGNPLVKSSSPMEVSSDAAPLMEAADYLDLDHAQPLLGMVEIPVFMMSPGLPDNLAVVQTLQTGPNSSHSPPVPPDPLLPYFHLYKCTT